MTSKAAEETAALERVAAALDRVDEDTKRDAYEMAKSMPSIEVMKGFNQSAIDLFSTMDNFCRKLKLGKKYDVSGYRELLTFAIKQNVKIPINKFTLIILEYAPEIYAEEVDKFLGMEIPVTEVKMGNAFSVIKTETFKEMWRLSSKEDKNYVGKIFINMTFYAQVYFYQTIISNTK